MAAARLQKQKRLCEKVTITTTCKALMAHVAPQEEIINRKCKKIAVIGAGTVGTTISFALLAQGITNELILMDLDSSLVKGEMMDMEFAKMYMGSPHIISSDSYDDLENISVFIIAVGARGDDENKEEAAVRNTEIFKEIIPEIAVRSPEAILVIVSSPVEIMSYVAWKLSSFPPQRVMGLGTVLESASFRRLIAEKLGVSIKCCQAFIIGEQGPNSLPVWSAVSVSGVRLKSVNPDIGTADDPEDWAGIHKEVVQSTSEVAKLKTMGSWGTALSVARIVKVILDDTKECMPVSTHIKGCRHGVDKDVFMSLPCILGKSGVELMVRQDLNDTEKEILQASADRMKEIQDKLKLDEEDE